MEEPAQTLYLAKSGLTLHFGRDANGAVVIADVTGDFASLSGEALEEAWGIADRCSFALPLPARPARVVKMPPASPAWPGRSEALAPLKAEPSPLCATGRVYVAHPVVPPLRALIAPFRHSVNRPPAKAMRYPAYRARSDAKLDIMHSDLWDGKLFVDVPPEAFLPIAEPEPDDDPYAWIPMTQERQSHLLTAFRSAAV